MPSVGPTLPPHRTKRSRDSDDERASSSDSGDKRRRVAGPAPLPSAASPRRTVGPSLPPNLVSRSSSEDSDAGPAPPPASALHHHQRLLTSGPQPLPQKTRTVVAMMILDLRRLHLVESVQATTTVPAQSQHSISNLILRSSPRRRNATTG
jgi:hypothetical protein